MDGRIRLTWGRLTLTLRLAPPRPVYAEVLTVPDVPEALPAPDPRPRPPAGWTRITPTTLPPGPAAPDPEALAALIEAAKRHKMTPEEEHEQRISFAYGNAKLHNPAITRADVEAAADRLDPEALAARLAGCVDSQRPTERIEGGTP